MPPRRPLEIGTLPNGRLQMNLGRMFVALTAILVLGWCSKPTASGKDVTGLYTLATINGQPLPVQSGGYLVVAGSI